MTNTTRIALLIALAAVARPSAQSTGPSPLAADADRLAAAVQPKVVSWRRDFHQHPELGNQEVRTAGIVAQHLKALGFEVQTNVAHTGVVGVLRGAKPGKVVALRADMDGLPVTEEVDLPFASNVRATRNGEEVGVMHACGHDNHVAILMGVAEVLAGRDPELRVRPRHPPHGEILRLRAGGHLRGRGGPEALPGAPGPPARSGEGQGDR